MIVIKLGGSVITQKDKPFTPDLNVLYEIAKVFGKFCKENPEQTVSLVHGGGSFAHVVASQYSDRSELTTKTKRGVALIAWSARKLNDRVIESLVDHDVPVFPLQTSSVFHLTKSGPKMNRDIFANTINNGWVPVLYGDIILGDGVVKILPGEEIVQGICSEFQVQKVIMCTNVPGVMRDINNPAAGIFDKINSGNLTEVLSTIEESYGIDVTGGMKQKVMEMHELAKEKDVSTLIIDGTDSAVLLESLRGDDSLGTLIGK